MIVSERLHHDLANYIHQNHSGISWMKSVAQSYIWCMHGQSWTNVASYIWKILHFLSKCKGKPLRSSVAPLHLWVWPAKPWQRIHVDFAGPFIGKMFFIIVDTHSKWLEVANTNDFYLNRSSYQCFTSNVCSHYKWPWYQTMVHNLYISNELYFMKGNGVKHIKCSP